MSCSETDYACMVRVFGTRARAAGWETLRSKHYPSQAQFLWERGTRRMHGANTGMLFSILILPYDLHRKTPLLLVVCRFTLVKCGKVYGMALIPELGLYWGADCSGDLHRGYFRAGQTGIAEKGEIQSEKSGELENSARQERLVRSRPLLNILLNIWDHIWDHSQGLTHPFSSALLVFLGGAMVLKWGGGRGCQFCKLRVVISPPVRHHVGRSMSGTLQNGPIPFQVPVAPMLHPTAATDGRSCSCRCVRGTVLPCLASLQGENIGGT